MKKKSDLICPSLGKNINIYETILTERSHNLVARFLKHKYLLELFPNDDIFSHFTKTWQIQSVDLDELAFRLMMTKLEYKGVLMKFAPIKDSERKCFCSYIKNHCSMKVAEENKNNPLYVSPDSVKDFLQCFNLRYFNKMTQKQRDEWEMFLSNSDCAKKLNIDNKIMKYIDEKMHKFFQERFAPLFKKKGRSGPRVNFFRISLIMYMYNFFTENSLNYINERMQYNLGLGIAENIKNFLSDFGIYCSSNAIKKSKSNFSSKEESTPSRMEIMLFVDYLYLCHSFRQSQDESNTA